MSNEQMKLFGGSDYDQKRSDELKEKGMKRAVEFHGGPLILARQFAFKHAFEKGEVTADDVSEFMEGIGETIGPWMGSVFRSKKFVWTGRFTKSRRVSNHSRLLRVWKLK